MADNEKGAFFDEFIRTGLLDDANVILQTVRFRNWDYQGAKDAQGNAINELGLSLKVVNLDDNNKESEEVLSAGKLQFFVPSSDGKKALPVGKYQKLNINTNAADFIMSLMNADTRGQMTAKLKTTDDISVLDGIRVHLTRKAQPKRISISVLPGTEEKERTVLVVDKVISYPWEAPGTVAAPAAAAPVTQAAPVAAAAPAAPAAAAASPVADTAAALLLQIVLAEGGSIKKMTVAGKVFSHPEGKALDTAVRNQVLGIIVKDDFLLSTSVTNMGMKYDPGTGTVSMAS